MISLYIQVSKLLIIILKKIMEARRPEYSIIPATSRNKYGEPKECTIEVARQYYTSKYQIQIYSLDALNV